MIDSHHHLWKYNPNEYGWISGRLAPIRRDFLPEHFEPVIHEADVTGTILVQVRQTIEETEWMLSLAGRHAWIRGVVGWAPLTQTDVARHLEKFAANTHLKGIRHIVQDEPDDAYILRDDFNRGIAQLGGFGLVYDILIYERHLPAAIRFVDRHPNQVFVLDHMAKPRIRDRELSPWRENLRELARRENVYCKLSGLVTEADWSAWKPDDLRPYVDVALEAFGPARLMFGSDWPVMLLASDYRRWLDFVHVSIMSLSERERQQVLTGTAIHAYRLQTASVSGKS